jgi:hypothetical protein
MAEIVHLLITSRLLHYYYNYYYSSLLDIIYGEHFLFSLIFVLFYLSTYVVMVLYPLHTLRLGFKSHASKIIMNGGGCSLGGWRHLLYLVVNGGVQLRVDVIFCVLWQWRWFIVSPCHFLYLVVVYCVSTSLLVSRRGW